MNNREAMQKAFEGQKFKVFSTFKCDISNNEDGNYVDDETIFAFAWFCRGIASQAQQPTDLSKQLREYAADSGYSHNDYADTMLAAASEIERLTASQTQQESRWNPIETAPIGKEFLLAFYYRHRPHDVLRRVVTFIDKDIIALGWSEIPPAPEGGDK